ESREDESEEEESEEEGDNEYDYGFVGGKDSSYDDDDEDYEVDISGMNVSPEILAMLGASEEVINAKKTEIEEVASTWIPPKESGLEHSDVIANHNEIALLQEGGADKRNLKVVRVMNKVGEYSNSGNNRNYGSPEESTGATTTLLEPLQITTINVKGKHGFESVPEIKKSQLSQEDIDDSTGSDCSEASASWDELSMVEGMPWCMVNSDDEIEEGTLEFVSPNLHKILGFNPPGKKEVDTGNGSPSGSTWTPPTFSGLMNSKPIVTLQQLTVNGGSGMQVQMKDRNLPRQDSEGRNEHEDDESSWDSDEDGEWDYK
ncbi:unnamed protein product, partial [Choristocarpus tenellus]